MPGKQDKKLALENFISKARVVHGDRYDYSESIYVDAHTSLLVKCGLHGGFLIRPDAHLYQKQGCRECGYINRRMPQQKSNDKFVAQAREKWGDLYDYSETKYVKKLEKITYGCKKHGKIEQLPTLHLRSGCPYCNGRGISRHTTESFVNLARGIHGEEYDYSKSSITKITDYATIICRKHGEFVQRANNHIHLRNGCPACDAEKTSSCAEKQLTEFIQSLYSGEVSENDRIILSGKEIDVYLPSLKVGFEYHGMYWHVETVVGRTRHWDKANAADEAGVQVIQVYEHEWLNKKVIVESKIKCLLGLGERIYARKTRVERLTAYQKNEFLSKTHMQGPDGSTIAYRNYLRC